MNIFTYRDYLKSIHTVRLNAVLQLADDSEKYQLYNDNIEKNIRKNSDKLDVMRKALRDKDKMARFINVCFVSSNKVESQDLIEYGRHKIAKRYDVKEPDIVYKIKSKDRFFLIEFTESVDYNMPYKMLNYCIDIMQSWIRGKNVEKVSHYPIVIPIVVYTGNDKWYIQNNKEVNREKKTTFGQNKVDLKYNVINISEYKDDLDLCSIFS